MKDLFGKLDYFKYLKKYKLDELLDIDLSTYGEIKKKREKDPLYGVANISEAFPPELDDLVRLHYLVTSRKVTTILEFGVGKSSIIFNDALEYLKNNFAHEANNLRRKELFKCFSVDNNKKWINEVKNNNNLKNVLFNYTSCIHSDFNGRVCTLYKKLPNICPDLIYLDAPDQFSPIGSIRGISTRHPDRVPMAADILTIEHFLLPGTLIVVDGRAANARFLKSNLQRNWNYSYSEDFDQHFFELKEKPLGRLNLNQIIFSLGKSWIKKIKD